MSFADYRKRQAQEARRQAEELEELKTGHVRVLSEIYPSPENDAIYAPIAWDDPETIALTDSIKEHGIKDPIWITEDGYIISGHRRRIAALKAGLKQVPVKIEPISRVENQEQFLKLSPVFYN
jgi:hypothetical protein